MRFFFNIVNYMIVFNIVLTITYFFAECGIARNKRRIVGGAETNERQYPWMVMLLYNGRMFCGGSLINDLYVMTASHCTG